MAGFNPSRRAMRCPLFAGWVKRFQTIHHDSVDVAHGLGFSSESAPGPFHHGIRRRGGTIFGAALPLDKRQVQADIRSHLIHRPARDIIPPLGGPQCSPVTVDLARFMPLQRSWSIGTQCRLPRCGA